MGSIGDVATRVSEFVTPKWGQKADANEELVESAIKVNTKPLWTQMAKLNPPEPNPKCIPFIWRYDEVRPSLLRAGEVVSEQQAERRVLMLVNPARGIIHTSYVCSANYTDW
jgi:gentisate 1,2-dioxygenase